MELCKQMQQLRYLLDKKNIEWEDDTEVENNHIWISRTYFTYKNNNYSVINGFGTYGGISYVEGKNHGLLELMCPGVNNGEPLGWLTAEECIKVIEGEQV